MENLNTSHTELFMRKYCKERPTFTTGKKNVIQSNWHLRRKIVTFAILQFWIWPSIALSIYFFDLIFRYFKRFFTRRIKLISMELPTQSAIFLTFRINENISIQPGQYILLQCENLSTLEWHPFTITDFAIEPKQTTFSLAASVRGDWTGELYQKIFNYKLHSEKSRRRRSSSRRRRTPAPRKLIFALDGPFPSTMESITSNERVVLIGAGIGVTPYISMFNYIMWRFLEQWKKEISYNFSL